MNAKKMSRKALLIVVMSLILSACGTAEGATPWTPAAVDAAVTQTLAALTNQPLVDANTAVALTVNAAIGNPTATLTAMSTPTRTPRPTKTPIPLIATLPAPETQPVKDFSLDNYETFTYTPGGESFGKVGYDVTDPKGEEACFRVWQATNLKNLAWTALFCNWKASNPAPKQQWPHPTQLTISGTGTVEFDLYRDFAEPNAYDVANAQNSPLGLGWFTQGFNGTTCVNGQCQDLSGGGVFQMSFPKNWDGHYHVGITVHDGQIQFWQGERATNIDNWPLP